MSFRSAIDREDLILPSTVDFISEFGCQYKYDENNHTEYYEFEGNNSSKAKIWIGSIDRTFSMSISIQGAEYFLIQNVNLQHIKIDGNDHSLLIKINENGSGSNIRLSLLPQIYVSIS